MTDDDDDDLQGRLDALSISEMRRRCDAAVGYVREMRRAYAVDVGMKLEDAPGPRPQVDPKHGERVLAELMEMLPLLRRRLTPEERARMVPMDETRSEQMKEVLDELASQPELFDSLMEESGQELRHADVLRMRENFQKTEMLKDVERELLALTTELREHQARLRQNVAELIAGAGKPEN